MITNREKEILEYIAKGYRNKEIGIALSLSPSTIRNHLSKAYAKLQVDNRIKAVNKIREIGSGNQI